MLYIGYFSFEKQNSLMDIPGPFQCEFTYVVEAANLDEACEIMAVELQEKQFHVIEGATTLMLDDILEFRAVPAGGIVARVQESPAGQPTMYSVLPLYEGDDVADYRQGPDPSEDLEAANSFEPEPFLVLVGESAPSRRKKKRRRPN